MKKRTLFKSQKPLSILISAIGLLCAVSACSETSDLEATYLGASNLEASDLEATNLKVPHSIVTTKTHPQTEKGKLLIVGGALSGETADIYQHFLQAIPEHFPDIAIVPLASSSPARSAENFKNLLVRYGATEDRIHILPLAVKDDTETETDESLWIKNASDQSLANTLKSVGGFWFVGGDQMRIVTALMPRDNQPTPVLKTLREQLNKGAIVGGTSAGAAIMSDIMIAAGDSFSALTLPTVKQYEGTESQEQGQLYVHHGLGFFPYGIVDQHFDRKARLGRLARTLAISNTDLGVGIDENTGLLVDLATDEVTVLGSGAVSILDASQAQFSEQPFSATNLNLSLLTPGDRYNLIELSLLHTNGSPTVGHEYAAEAPHQGAGLALANGRLEQLLSYQLLDNANSTEIKRYNFIETGEGFMYRFKQTKNSRGFWSANDGSMDKYTIENVMFEIEPVQVQITPTDTLVQ
ncbi:cyanophycinase [Pseudomaricurvus sp.]|uniref:cyanophycinase n=1 Tax=Pseudomaricurvus sp. TaxID=2004510 RepID=UPI003F6AF067